jgi:diguanylate cyclase (GGDEF)-like protein
VGKTDRDFFSSEHAEQALADGKEILRTGNPMPGLEEKETWPDGRETWVLTTKVPLRDSRGRIVGTMGISHDINDRRRAEAQIQHMALHDALTGLPNRVYLKDFLGRAVKNGRATKSGVAVLLLDLDHFKEVNDSMGHHAGDQLLESVSRRLKNCVRESDFVARLGGDEFVLVLPAVSGELSARQIAIMVLTAISAPICIQDRQLRVGASIGVAQFPQNGRTPEDLLRAADAAMYEAKAKGRGQYCFSNQADTGAIYLASA